LEGRGRADATAPAATVASAAAACVKAGKKCGNGQGCCQGTACKGKRCRCLNDLKVCRGACVPRSFCCVGERLETVVVPADGSMVTTTTRTRPGQQFRFRASGTFANGETRCDAEFCFNPNNLQELFDRCGDRPIGTDLGIVVNNVKASWGDVFRLDHTYEIDLFVFGEEITLRYTDCASSDNIGSLTVEIIRCG
jgi:hypothetical protein